MTGFTVRQEHFEGPLEVLLNLIEQRKLHISDVGLSKVTDDFLNYAKSFPNFPIAESAQFAYVASTLLLIKSKSLLPQLSLSREEEESIEDLQNRLKLLQRFRELSRHVKARFGEAPSHLPLPREVVPVFAPQKEMSLSLLRDAVKAVLASIPKVEKLSKVAIRKVISLEHMIENLKERITGALRMSFKEFSGAHKGERVNIIVGFLAMLELVKDGLIHVTQETPNGDIMMETGTIEVPRY
ncbi:MAG: ScpA family protein [bacterium]|nr:ScpA family protein [bacterium]